MTPSELLRICRDEAHYLVFRKRVPMDVDDLTQDAAILALEKASDSPALTRIVVRFGLRNVVRHHKARPGGVRFSGGASQRSLPREEKTEDPKDSAVPEEMRVYQEDCPSQLILSQLFTQRGSGWNPVDFNRASAAARFERVKSASAWYQKNRRKYDLFEGSFNDAGVAG